MTKYRDYIFRVTLVFIKQSHSATTVDDLYQALCCHITQQPLVRGTIFPYRCFINILTPDEVVEVRHDVIIVNMLGHARRITS